MALNHIIRPAGAQQREDPLEIAVGRVVTREQRIGTMLLDNQTYRLGGVVPVGEDAVFLSPAQVQASTEVADMMWRFPQLAGVTPQWGSLRRFLRTLEIEHGVSSPNGEEPVLLVGSGAAIAEAAAFSALSPEKASLDHVGSTNLDTTIQRMHLMGDRGMPTQSVPQRGLRFIAVDPRLNQLSRVMRGLNLHFGMNIQGLSAERRGSDGATIIPISMPIADAVNTELVRQAPFSDVLIHRVEPSALGHFEGSDPSNWRVSVDLLLDLVGLLKSGGNFILTAGSGDDELARHKREVLLLQVNHLFGSDPRFTQTMRRLDIPLDFREDSTSHLLYGGRAYGMIGGIAAVKN